MTETWRQTITNVSEHIFPGISYYNPPIDDYFIKLGNEIVSSLPLQMSLYFNVIFFPIWFIITLLMLSIKFSCLSMLYRIIVSVVIVVVISIEVVRLYLGYIGIMMPQLFGCWLNGVTLHASFDPILTFDPIFTWKQNEIPELAGFWILSLLLQSPLQLFLLLNGSLHPPIIERVVQTVMVVFLLTQVFTGYSALQTAAQHSAEQFHIAQLKVPDFSTHFELRTKSD